MRTIVLASQKGGAGKTTLAAHLAVAAEAAGLGPVVMIDTDPQGTLRKWWDQREANTPGMADIPITQLAGKLPDLAANGIKLLVIDTPPQATDLIRSVIRVADLVLLPVRPSPADLWAVGATLDLCREASKPYAFALTQATRGALLTAQAIAALSAHGTVSTAIIHNRVAYAGALSSGQTIQEFEPRSGGVREVQDLLAFVLLQMNGSKPARKKELLHGC